MALLFDGFNDYLRIAHDEIVFPNQVCGLGRLSTLHVQFTSSAYSWCFQTMFLALPCG
jgi:hypothetical protein